MSDITVQSAIFDLLYHTGITPRSPLAAPIAVGDTKFQPADTSHFMAGSVFGLYDGTGEELLDIKSTDGTYVYPDFSGLGYSGFQHVHPAGTVAYANLYDEMPDDPSSALAAGDPFVWVSTRTEDLKRVANRQVGAILLAHIQYHRNIDRGESVLMARHIWKRRQQRAARTDLNTIGNAITNNQQLAVNGVPQVVAIGQDGRLIYRKAWEHVPTEMGMLQFIGAIDLYVQDQFTSF